MPRIINNDIARFWSKVDKNGPVPAHRPELGKCWRWLGSFTERGYSQFWSKGKMRRAHVFSFALNGGVVPSGLELDHLCRNRGCVNPSHLEPVTHRENMLRSDSPPAWHIRQTHCLRGHEFTKENTKLSRSGERRCRKCIAIRNKKGYAPVRSGNYEDCGNAKLTRERIREIHTRSRSGVPRKTLCIEFDISYSAIEKILRGVRWPEIFAEFNKPATARLHQPDLIAA